MFLEQHSWDLFFTTFCDNLEDIVVDCLLRQACDSYQQNSAHRLFVNSWKKFTPILNLSFPNF